MAQMGGLDSISKIPHFKMALDDTVTPPMKSEGSRLMPSTQDGKMSSTTQMHTQDHLENTNFQSSLKDHSSFPNGSILKESLLEDIPTPYINDRCNSG